MKNFRKLRRKRSAGRSKNFDFCGFSSVSGVQMNMHVCAMVVRFEQQAGA